MPDNEIYFPDYPLKLTLVGDDLFLIADSEDLDVDDKPKFKKFKFPLALRVSPTVLEINATTYIPGAVGRMMLFGTDEATASPANTIWEYIGDVAVMTNLDQSVRAFMNDQEIRIDTFNNTAAGEARLVACKLRGTVQTPLPLQVGDVAGTLEIAGALEQDGQVYPRAFLMIRTIVNDVADSNGWMPTITVFYNRKVDGADNTVPDEAGRIDKFNNWIFGTITSPSDVFNPAVAHVKGNNGGFAKFAIGDTGGANDHDEFLQWSEDNNAGRGDIFDYMNPIDGKLIRHGNAIVRIRNGTSIGQTGNMRCEGNMVFGFPRVTTVQRDAMTGLLGGDSIFNIDLAKGQQWDGSTWQNLY